ncbi:hypothetical protein [Brackiella oedipodis]|uniref:hypothetical protein n=1 Tax=Brackiella oedipodis TaxID=124225 RepID=UPI0006861BE3|nr:hypothetical protein [Brackiella oedipodis]
MKLKKLKKLKKRDSQTLNQFMLASACAFGILITGYTNVHAAARKGNNDHDIAYMTGGYGQSEQYEIKQEAQHYNVHFTFAEAKERAYLSDVEVTIKNAKGETIFTEQHTGPFLYIQLPEGKYTATLSSQNRSHEKHLTVSAHSKSDLVITW